MPKSEKKWIPVLRTGHFKGGNGVEIDVDRDRLDRIVSNYNAELSETPLVIGHPKTDDPAFGWVEKFKRVGDVLMALPSKIVPEFAAAINDGFYKYVSCKVCPNDTIRHIGFLGAVPPAVSGLGAVTLSGADSGCDVELAQADLWIEKSLFRRLGMFISRLRDQEIEENGVDAGNKIITSDELSSFQRDIDNLEIETDVPQVPILSGPETGSEGETGMDPKELQRLLDVANGKIAELSATNKELSDKLATATSETSTLKTEKITAQRNAKEAEFNAFCDDLVGQGKMAGGDKKTTVELLMQVSESGAAELSLADGTGKISAVDFLKKKLQAGITKVQFGEHATREKAAGASANGSSAAELSKEIDDYIIEEKNKGRTVTVVDALAHIRKRA